METLTLQLSDPAQQRRQAVKNFVNLLELELLEELEENPDTARSAEEVLGTISRESFDVQMAIYERDDLKFRREHFDLCKKVSLSYIDSRLKYISVTV